MMGVGAVTKQLLDHCGEGVEEVASYVSVSAPSRNDCLLT